MTMAAPTEQTLRTSAIHRSAVGVCVALLLSFGLVSIPMSCACGAGVPHGHSLFILPGHYHGAERVHFNDVESNGHGDYHGDEMAASSVSSPQLAGRIMHSVDRVVVALPLTLLSAESWQRFVQPATVPGPGEGRVDTPESPPPRPAFQA